MDHLTRQAHDRALNLLATLEEATDDPAAFALAAARLLSALAPTLPELTPREREVLHWLASGKTDADIGRLLGISVRTVHKHLEHIYVKLGVETRTAAAMRALGLHGLQAAQA